MAASGQTASGKADDSIVVTGSKATAEEARDRIEDYIQQTGVGLGQRPVARWIDPVCPKVIGLEADIAKIFEQKMRSVAQSNGIRLAGGRCQSNIVVAFTHDGAGLVQQIRKREPAKLSSVKLADRAELVTGEAPVRWWYSYETRGSDGRRATTAPLPWVGGGEGGVSVLPNIETIAHYNSSIVSTQTARAITQATVIVDVTDAEGVRLDAVADYAAFVAFAEIVKQEMPPSGSILALFQEDSVQELSAIDIAFLQALYRLPLDRKARQQRGLLAKKMTVANTGSE